VAGLVIAAVLVTGLTFMNYTESLVDQFGFAILLATLTTVVPYAFAAAAELALFIREPERFTNARFVRDSVIALLGFGYAVWAMYATGSEAIAKGFLLLMAGIPVYLWVRWRAARRAPVEEPHVLVTVPEDDAFVPAGDELLRITH
jgi:APA family basic amino acid/polyamine antiporter